MSSTCLDCTEEIVYNCLENGCGEDYCAEDCTCDCTDCQRNRDTDEEESDDDSHSTTSTICDGCMGPCAGLGRIYKNKEVHCENCYGKEEEGHMCHDCDAVTNVGRWDDEDAEDRAWYCADCVKKHDDAVIKEREED